LVALALALGCAGGPAPEIHTARDLAGAPAWVREGKTAFHGEKGQILGVGASAAALEAQSRGAAEVARMLDRLVQDMVRDYSASVDRVRPNIDDQYLARVSRELCEATLSGLTAAETWASPGGVVYALVVLDVQRFKDVASQLVWIDHGLLAALVERADRAFAGP
jgi:hypothetical protein